MEINATLVVQIVLFLLLLAWLSHFLFSPLLKLFEERERRIEGARREAQELQHSAHQKLEMVEEKIRQAQKEARLILAELKAEGIEYQRRLLDAAKREAKQKSEAAQEQLEQSVQRLKMELRQEIPSLVQEVVHHFLSAGSLGASKSHFDKLESRRA